MHFPAVPLHATHCWNSFPRGGAIAFTQLGRQLWLNIHRRTCREYTVSIALPLSASRLETRPRPHHSLLDQLGVAAGEEGGEELKQSQELQLSLTHDPSCKTHHRHAGRDAHPRRHVHHRHEVALERHVAGVHVDGHVPLAELVDGRGVGGRHVGEGHSLALGHAPAEAARLGEERLRFLEVHVPLGGAPHVEVVRAVHPAALELNSGSVWGGMVEK